MDLTRSRWFFVRTRVVFERVLSAFLSLFIKYVLAIRLHRLLYIIDDGIKNHWKHLIWNLLIQIAKKDWRLFLFYVKLLFLLHNIFNSTFTNKQNISSQLEHHINGGTRQKAITVNSNKLEISI